MIFVASTRGKAPRGEGRAEDPHDESHFPDRDPVSNLESSTRMSSIICSTVVVQARASAATRATDARATVMTSAGLPKPRNAVSFPSARGRDRDVSVRMGRKGMLADLMDDGTDSAGDPVPAKVDPRCPCGSGNKFKKCHGGWNTPEAMGGYLPTPGGGGASSTLSLKAPRFQMFNLMGRISLST